MFAYVRGIVADIAEDNCVIDVHDVGLNVKISAQTAMRLPGVGEMALLYTYTCVREDAFQLYGFLSKNELDIFKQCILVSGIGPKGALALLSAMDADSLRFAIISQDVKAICRAPGIGKRTAERLILDLKDKLSIEGSQLGQEAAAYGSATAFRSENPQIQEAVEALVSLGYGQSEASRAVSQVENAEQLDSGALLKAALKKMF